MNMYENVVKIKVALQLLKDLNVSSKVVEIIMQDIKRYSISMSRRALKTGMHHFKICLKIHNFQMEHDTEVCLSSIIKGKFPNVNTLLSFLPLKDLVFTLNHFQDPEDSDWLIYYILFWLHC